MLSWVIPFLLFQLSLIDTSLQDPLMCKNSRSKICLLQNVTVVSFETPDFPDLNGKHTLIIRSGSVKQFTQKIASACGDVTKVTIDRLEIETLYIPAHWTYLSAESNRIRKLIVNPKDVLEEPLDDDPNTELSTEVSVFENNITNDSNVTAPEKDNKFEEIVINFPENSTIAKSTKIDTPVVGQMLQKLTLANNKLKSIHELRWLINLEELNLQGNELELVKMETFMNMTQLRKLSLANNKINHISCLESIQLPSLEWFSLAFNDLRSLHVSKWDMLQLVQLDISHNKLVKLDVASFDQFISLEKLAVNNNSWTCYWLQKALLEITERDFITLVDRDDERENCPKGLPVEGICCSLTKDDNDDSRNANVLERIQQFQQHQDSMDKDLRGKIESYLQTWNVRKEILSSNLTQQQRTIDAKTKEPKDDSKVTERDISDLSELIRDCNELLEKMQNFHINSEQTAQKYSNLFYTTMHLKNKLLAAKKKSETLKNEMQNYKNSLRTLQ